MDSRQRFIETMRYGEVDRPPLFEDGLREEVLATWRHQGLPANTDLSSLFLVDQREELEPNLLPSPELEAWPSKLQELKELEHRLDPRDANRLPDDWQERVRRWQNRQHVLMLRVQRGFFLSMGVEGWKRFYEVMALAKDDPAFVRQMMAIQGEFSVRLTERVLQEVEIDAAVFSEPIGGNHGPLISPAMYAELVLPSYQPLLKVLQQHNIQVIILRTYANVAVLIPLIIEAGFNCLWAVEVETQAMDYRALRQRFGRDLRLIGGIDRDILYQDKAAIRREMEEKALPLVASGGYAPLADGRVREDVRWENYLYYRRLLEKLGK